MTRKTKSAPVGIKNVIAEAIANARGMRNGVPPISNILDILPPKLIDEVMSDADSVIHALKENNLIK